MKGGVNNKKSRNTERLNFRAANGSPYFTRNITRYIHHSSHTDKLRVPKSKLVRVQSLLVPFTTVVLLT